jgi:outer membrane autotransporter protein
VPIFRPEAALYAKVPLVARQVSYVPLNSFEARLSDQMFEFASADDGSAVSVNAAQLKAFDTAPAVWGRMFGQNIKQAWTGPLSPEFNGNVYGGEVGVDLARFATAPGHFDEVGLFYSFAATSGTGSGFIRDTQRMVGGTMAMSTHTVSGYWMHVGPEQWYIDAVVMGAFFSTHTRSIDDIQEHFSGSSLVLSLDGGYPFRLDDDLRLEAQGQIIWQTAGFNRASDPFTSLDFKLDDTFTGRAGLRLLFDNARLFDTPVEPRLTINLWRNFGGTDTVVYNNIIPVPSRFGATALEFGGGLSAYPAQDTEVFADVSYTTNIGGAYRRTVQGTIGVRFSW